MKIAIIYHSSTGNTEKAAGFIKEGLLKSGDIDVRLMNIEKEDSLDIDFIHSCSGVIIGTPTYAASMSWQVKKWFDTDKRVNLSGKLGGAFATANFAQGGLAIAVTSILQHLLVKGMVVYSSGAAYGQPYIHLGPVTIASELDNSRDLFVIFGQRFGEKAQELFTV